MKEWGSAFDIIEKSQEKEVNLGVFLPRKEVVTKYDREKVKGVSCTASARDFRTAGHTSDQLRTTFDVSLHKSSSWPLPKADACHSTDPSTLDLLADELLNGAPELPPQHTLVTRTTTPTPVKNPSTHMDTKNALAMEFLSLNNKNSKIGEILTTDHENSHPLPHTHSLSQKMRHETLTHTHETDDALPNFLDENLSTSQNFETISQLSRSIKSMKRMFSPSPHSNHENGDVLQKFSGCDRDDDSVMWQAGGWLCKPDEQNELDGIYGEGLDICDLPMHRTAEDFIFPSQMGVFDGLISGGVGVGVGVGYDSMKSCPNLNLEFRKKK